MIETQRQNLRSIASIGIWDTFMPLYENQYNPSLDVIPMVVVNGTFYAARIGSECVLRSYFPNMDEKTKLLVKLAIPLVLQLGVYFSISKMRQTSYKVWITSIGLKNLAYGVKLVIDFMKKKEDPVDTIEVLSGLFICFVSTLEMVNRSPSFPAASLGPPLIGYMLTEVVHFQQIVTHDLKFLAAPIISFELSKALHHLLQERRFNIKGPFPWKLVIAQQSALGISAWFFNSKNSPLYTPPAQ